MKAKELRGRDTQELRRELEQLQRELFDIRFQWQAEERPDRSRRRNLRRDVARYKTVLREMEGALDETRQAGARTDHE
ncbi:MAG: 50S ribosomal protein L29 [Candidatus Brocadiaceae bacterium]|nr:50S ribosomal protein L29 [Candidatus Brocadiaceae bacterium]